MDQYDELPEELKFLSNICDICKLQMTSPKFKSYVRNITNQQIINISLEKFFPFINLETVDHKIIIQVNHNNVGYLDDLQFLHQAHFCITGSNL